MSATTNTDADLEKLLQHIRRQFHDSGNDSILASPTANEVGRQLASFAPDNRVLQILKTCSSPVRCACLEALETTKDLQFLTEWCVALQDTEDGTCFRTFAAYCVANSPSQVYDLWDQAAEHRDQLVQEIIGAAFSTPYIALSDITAGLSPLMACCCTTEHKQRALHLLHKLVWKFFLSIDNEYDESTLLDHWLRWEWTLYEYCSKDDDVDWLLDLIYLSESPSNQLLHKISYFIQKQRSHHHNALLEASLDLSPLSFPVEASAVWELCAHCLTTPIAQHRCHLMLLVHVTASSSKDPLVCYWLNITAALIVPYGGESTTVAQGILQETDMCAAIQSLKLADLESFLGYSVNRITMNSKWKSLQQVAALLIALTAWDCGYQSLLETQLLPKYSQLGTLLVPFLFQRLHQQPTLPTLDLLLCSPIVAHPVAAQQVWSTIDDWWDRSSSLSIVVLRRLPRMIQQNGRLYRRSMERIGTCIQSNRDLDTRLAAAASLAECAELDVIRDVSDGVIGWVQALLSPSEEPVLVYYAVLTLHYLVVEEELDFNVVVTVLQKKLCSLDIVSLRKLPSIILEAIALLLGDGDCDEDEIPAQVSVATRALISMGQQLEFQPTEDHSMRVHQNIVNSLSNYPLGAMGVDESSINEATTEEPRENAYTELRDFALLSLERLPDFAAATAIASKITLVEEEVLGPSLWQRRRHAKIDGQGKPSLLPQKETVQSILASEPQNSIAVLTIADGKQLSVLRDNADSCLEASSSEPHMLMLCLQAFLVFSNNLVCSQDSITEAVAELKSWYELFLSPDAMFLALSSISFYLPIDSTEENGLLDSIYNDVTEAFEKDDFENEDIGKICLGLVGVGRFHSASFDEIDKVVEKLEATVTSYGGEQSFGAFFGLGIIGRECFRYSKSDKGSTNSLVEQLVYRINGFFLEQLLSCVEARKELAELVECVKAGKVSADLVNDIRGLDSNSIPILMTKHVAVRYLFTALSNSCASLAHVNGHLMLLIFRFLESLEWGTGKGLALPSIVRSCQSSGVLENEVIEQVYLDFVAVFEQRFDSGGDGTNAESAELEDIAHAVIGLKLTVPRDRRFQLPSLADLFDEESRSHLMLSSFSTTFSFPVLGPFHQQSAPRIVPVAEGVDITSTIDDIVKAASDESSAKTAFTATILLSLLTCIEEESRDVDDSPNTTVTNISLEPKSTMISFAKLSTAQEGTLTSAILGRLEQSFHTADFTPGSNVISRYLPSLHAVSIPDNYGDEFVKPLLKIGSLKDLILSFLCAQVSTRRRAFSPGPSFVSLVSGICQSTATEWSRWIDESKESFIDSFGGFGLRLPTKSTEQCLHRLWGNSKSSSSANIVGFLRSTKLLLQSTTISPKSLSIVRSFVLTTICDDMFSFPIDGFMELSENCSMLEGLASCLEEIPLQLLDTSAFSRLDASGQFSSECCKACTLLELIKSGYYSTNDERVVREISNVKTFLSIAVLKLPNEIQLIRRVVCRYCAVAVRNGGTLDILFELLLLADPPSCGVGLEWLAVYAGVLDDSNPILSKRFLIGDAGSGNAHTMSSEELQRFMELQVEGFSEALKSYCEREQNFSLTANNLLRIRDRWMELGISEKLQHVIDQAIAACHKERDSSYTRLVACKLEEIKTST